VSQEAGNAIFVLWPPLPDPIPLKIQFPFSNTFRITQKGDVTSVWLNGRLVVDAARMQNYWDPKAALPAKGPIQLQTHGGEIRWRNIWVKSL